jgi:hypothetical protein
MASKLKESPILAIKSIHQRDEIRQFLIILVEKCGTYTPPKINFFRGMAVNLLMRLLHDGEIHCWIYAEQTVSDVQSEEEKAKIQYILSNFMAVTDLMLKGQVKAKKFEGGSVAGFWSNVMEYDQAGKSFAAP